MRVCKYFHCKSNKSKSKNYVCESCDYSTSQKANYEKHLLTAKHIKTTMTTICSHVCSCGQSYSNRQNLFRHKKSCDVVNKSTAKVAKVAELLPNAPKLYACECKLQAQVKTRKNPVINMYVKVVTLQRHV